MPLSLTDAEAPAYSIDEANAMIPDVERVLTRILQIRAHIATHEAQLGPADDPLGLHGVLGASHSPRRSQTRAALEGLRSLLDDETEALDALGVELRSLEPGIVEWPSTQDGREILLGWRYGSTRVDYWRDRDPGSELHPIEDA